MSSDTPASGPQSIDEYLDGHFEDTPETEPMEEDGQTEGAEPEAEAEVEEPEVEESDEAEAPEEGEGPQVLTVDEYGDIQIQVGDETTTLADLHKGHLRQQDYTRKTQELAQQRQQMQQEFQQLQESIAEKERLLEQQFAEQDLAEPDWEKLAEEDPLGVVTERIKWEKRRDQQQKARAQAQQRAEQQRQQFMAQTAELAVQKIPEWSEKGGFDKSRDARRKAALDAGFTEQEYNQAADFRLAVLLEKAARYDALQSDGAAAQKRVAKAPKVLKPGSAKTKADRQTVEKVAKSKVLDRPHSLQDHLKALGL